MSKNAGKTRLYCPECKKAVLVSEDRVCPECGKAIPETIDQEIRTPLAQGLHRSLNANAEKRDAAMSWVVLGAIFLIIGLIFIQLSFKVVSSGSEGERMLAADSLEFVIAMLGTCGGGLALLYGIVKAVYFGRKARVLAHDIDYINVNMRLDPGPTPLWVVTVYKNLSLRFKNYLKIKKVERANKIAAKKKPE